MGLKCPSAAALATFKAAVQAGHIDWHAFPHNAELATGDASMLKVSYICIYKNPC